MKNGYTQIDGKFYKECDVIMLPTDKPSPIGFHTDIAELGSVDYAPNFGFELFDRNNNFRHNPQYIYVTSDEEIKEGDWYIVNKIMKQCIAINQYKPEGDNRNKYFVDKLGNEDNSFWCKKIIAGIDYDSNRELITCGGELDLLSGDGEDGEGMTDPFFMKCEKCGETNFYNERNAQLGCYMHSGKYKDGLPRPSNEFLKAYAKAQGKIDKVLVEYIEYEREEMWFGSCNETSGTHIVMDYKLKVAPDNTITIKPINNKTYTEEEVITLLSEIVHDVNSFGMGGCSTSLQYAKKWFQK